MQDLIFTTAYISLVILSISMFLGLIRLIIGPNLADRVAALDFIAMLTIGMITTYAIFVDEPIFLDVAIALALVIFLGTVAFARFLEKGLRS